MNQSRTVKVIAVLLAVVLVLTVLAFMQTDAPLKVDDGTDMGVSTAEAVWQKTYGGLGDDRTFSMLPVQDGFLVVGSTKISNITNGWLLMLDSEGNTIWNHTYLDGATTELRCAVSIKEGYFLVGNQFTAGGDQNGYAAKVDLQGNIVWQKILGSVNVDKFFGGATSMDAFYIYGLTSQSVNNASTAAWTVKLDSDGNLVWNKTYILGADSALRSGVAVQDGGLALAGYVDHLGDGNYDFCLLKIASDGGLVWNRSYGFEESEKAYSMTSTSTGYVLVGEIESPQTSTDAMVMKTDFDGTTLWSRTLGGKGADSPSYITQARDDGLLVCGFTFSFGAGQRDFWMFKMTSEGQVQFSSTFGSESFQEAYSIVDLGSDQYIMAGWTDPVGKPDLVGMAQYDFLVAKLYVSPSLNGGAVNVWLVASSIVAFAALVTSLALLFKLRSKK